MCIEKANARRVVDLNRQHAGDAVFALNKFADLTSDEFKQRVLLPGGLDRHRARAQLHMQPIKVLAFPEHYDLPERFDWSVAVLALCTYLGIDSFELAVLFGLFL